MTTQSSKDKILSESMFAPTSKDKILSESIFCLNFCVLFPGLLLVFFLHHFKLFLIVNHRFLFCLLAHIDSSRILFIFLSFASNLHIDWFFHGSWFLVKIFENTFGLSIFLVHSLNQNVRNHCQLFELLEDNVRRATFLSEWKLELLCLMSLNCLKLFNWGF